MYDDGLMWNCTTQRNAISQHDIYFPHKTQIQSNWRTQTFKIHFLSSTDSKQIWHSTKISAFAAISGCNYPYNGLKGNAIQLGSAETLLLLVLPLHWHSRFNSIILSMRKRIYFLFTSVQSLRLSLTTPLSYSGKNQKTKIPEFLHYALVTSFCEYTLIVLKVKQQQSNVCWVLQRATSAH